MSISYHFRVVSGIEMDKVVQENADGSFDMNGKTYSDSELREELAKNGLQIHSRWGYTVNGHWNGTLYNAVIGGEILFEKEITEMPLILGKIITEYDLKEQNKTQINIQHLFPKYTGLVVLFMYVYEWR